MDGGRLGYIFYVQTPTSAGMAIQNAQGCLTDV